MKIDDLPVPEIIRQLAENAMNEKNSNNVRFNYIQSLENIKTFVDYKLTLATKKIKK